MRNGDHLMISCPELADLKAARKNKNGSQYDCFSVTKSSKLTAKFKVEKGIVEGIIDRMFTKE